VPLAARCRSLAGYSVTPFPRGGRLAVCAGFGHEWPPGLLADGDGRGDGDPIEDEGAGELAAGEGGGDDGGADDGGSVGGLEALAGSVGWTVAVDVGAGLGCGLVPEPVVVYTATEATLIAAPELVCPVGVVQLHWPSG
jgi:hypothetical protein